MLYNYEKNTPLKNPVLEYHWAVSSVLEYINRNYNENITLENIDLTADSAMECCDISGIRKWEDLPKAAQDYVLMIEKAVGCPIRYVSVGPERESIIIRD